MTRHPERDWLSVAEVAQLLGVSRTTVWRWIRAGHLPARRVGPRMLRVEKQVVDELSKPRRFGHTASVELAAFFSARDARRSRRILAETLGSLPDLDADAMIEYIYRGRDEGLDPETQAGFARERAATRERLARAADGVLDGWTSAEIGAEPAARQSNDGSGGSDKGVSLDNDDDWRPTPVDKERAAQLRAELFKDYDSEKARRAIREYGGSWADLDTDAMIAELYRSRDEGTRPDEER